MTLHVDMVVTYEDEEWRDVYVYINELEGTEGPEWAFPVTFNKLDNTITQGNALYASNNEIAFFDTGQPPPDAVQKRLQEVLPMAQVMARGDN